MNFKTRWTATIVAILLWGVAWFVLAPTEVSAGEIDRRLKELRLPGLSARDIGLTGEQTPVVALVSDAADELDTKKTRVLILGGMDRGASSVEAAIQCVEWFAQDEAAAPLRTYFDVSAVPCVFPDDISGSVRELAVAELPLYPPGEAAYGNAPSPEAAYVWRWIGMHAPDIVIDVRVGNFPAVFIPPSDSEQLRRLGAASSFFNGVDASRDLVAQVVKVSPSGTGTVPAIRLHVGSPGAPRDGAGRTFPTLLARLRSARVEGPSPARVELQSRLGRSALKVAEQLSQHYGHELKTVTYIPAVALVGRLRLGSLKDRRVETLADVERIVGPYIDGTAVALPEKASGSYLSGHLIFPELILTRLFKKLHPNDKEYMELARRAADRGFDASGNPNEAMAYHSEMSDAVFMGCPILAEVGRLTRETKYFDMCVRHMRFMKKLNLREDGLHRHSPLDEAAWGRGNGFPALGLAWSLSAFPEDYPGRQEMLDAFCTHIAALAQYQDVTGAWHQVVDVPGSYRELSSTCMITFAMVRGVGMGWLDKETYQPIIRRAWRAIRMRVASDGRLVDVCTGTGKQKNLQAYLDRRAILGPDLRGGAMSLLVSTEIATWERAGRE
ncbi:MAG: glycoside hydrolase family 88 protein [Planctomycetes bacterium]|nr:glycoside hydrolase family 88 protein [Planctomycetota bacterium]